MRLTVLLMVINTHKPVLEWCVSTVGAGRVEEAKATEKNPRRLRCFRYILMTQHALLWLLEQLHPRLRIKGAQVAAALRFLRSRASRPPRAAFNGVEVDALFDARVANQKEYDQGAHVTYKKKRYTREAFRALVLRGRRGSHYRVAEWNAQTETLLGTDTDGRIAERLGLRLSQVQKHRSRLGIAPFQRS